MPAKKVSPIESGKSKKETTIKVAPSNKISIKKPSKVEQTAKRIPIRRKRLSSIKSATGQTTLQTLLKDKNKSVSPLKSSAKVTAAPDSEFVFLPNTISIRAKEKVLAILSVSTDNFYLPAQRIAYISAFCFIVLGASMSLSRHMIQPEHQAAQITGAIAPILLETPLQKPQIAVLEQVPPVVSSPQWFNFTLPNARNVQVTVRSFETAKYSRLEVRESGPGNYQFYIDNETLLAAKYSLVVSASSLVGDDIFKFFIADFTITPIEVKAFDGEASTATDELPVVLSDPQTTSAPTENFSLPNPAPDSSESTTTTATPFVMNKLPRSIDAPLLITFDTPSETTAVELYLRPALTKTVKFIGLAAISNQEWRFLFDPKNTPVGKYEIFAKARIQTKFINSDSQLIEIIPKQTTIATTSLLTPSVPSSVPLTPIVKPQPVVDDIATNKTPVVLPVNVLRSFSDLSIDSATNTDEINPSARRVTDEVFQSNRDAINEILNRYAVAIQTGDPLLVEMAQQELLKKRTSLVQKLLAEGESVQYVGDIDTDIENRFLMLQKRVDTFEELRKTASNQSTSEDADKDGISDFDEIHLYGTDVNNPDTDNDGFNDGIELLRGYNATDASPEAALVFESPKESLGLLQPELLKIDSVTPVFTTVESGETLPVQAEIRGVGLPNSFVTLYIYSTPSVVTIKTDSDGSFVYTFEKELEDGEHEVYVAITDNTGWIVAQSNPFRFIKQAEAFTPLSETVSEVQSPQSFEDFSSIGSARTIAGMGFLALGIILLMLGVVMRERPLASNTQSPA